MKYKIWNKTDSLTAPTGAEFTAEQIFAKYAWSRKPNAKAIICDNVIELGVFMEFEATKAQYARMIDAAIASGTSGLTPITSGMTDEQVLAAITLFEETPQVSEPTAEERIAAAMEYQNLLTL